MAVDRLYRATVTIPANQVGSGGVLDFTVLLTHACFLTNCPEFLTLGHANAPQSDGGDLIVTTDQGGASRVALDVIKFALSATPADSEVQLAIGPLDLSNVANNTIYLWWGHASTQTQPAVDANYGQYAAYEAAVKGFYPFYEGSGYFIHDRTMHQSHLDTPRLDPDAYPITWDETGVSAYGSNASRRMGDGCVVDFALDHSLSFHCWNNTSSRGAIFSAGEGYYTYPYYFGSTWDGTISAPGLYAYGTNVAVRSIIQTPRTTAIGSSVVTGPLLISISRDGTTKEATIRCPNGTPNTKASGPFNTAYTTGSATNTWFNLGGGTTYGGVYGGGGFYFAMAKQAVQTDAEASTLASMVETPDSFASVSALEEVGGSAAKPWLYARPSRIIGGGLI